MITPEAGNGDSSTPRNRLQDSVVLVSTSEIVLKSPYVKGSLLRALVEHLRWKLRRAGFRDFKTMIDGGRIVVSGLKDSDAAEVCSQVFGVAATASAIRLPSEPSTLVEEVSRYADDFLSENDSFAVRVRVVGQYPTSSREIERNVGSAVLARLGKDKVSVDLDHPKKTIHVEIRGDSLYLYERHIEGFGGLPYSCQGRLVAMLSEDIDTAVASWLMMKRGSHVIPLFIETTGGHEQKMVDMARKLREFAPVNEYRLVIAPFLEIAKSISSVKEEQCKWLLHKRMMYRVACSVAKKLCALGIITGERLDIDSRTLLNLSTIDEVAGFAVYRPLIGLDEMEVQTLARRIGLCEVRAQGEENASISRDEPVLIELDRIRAIEKDLHVDLLVQNALQKTRKIDL